MNFFAQILYRILREYPPKKFTFAGDEVALTMDLIGGSLIALTFITIGIVCLLMAGKDNNKVAYNERKVLTRLFGVFLLSCGISRIFSEISMWHNFAFVEAFLKLFTGLISLATLFLIPRIVIKMNEAKTITELSERVEHAKDTLQEVKNKLNETSS